MSDFNLDSNRKNVNYGRKGLLTEKYLNRWEAPLREKEVRVLFYGIMFICYLADLLKWRELPRISTGELDYPRTNLRQLSNWAVLLSWLMLFALLYFLGTKVASFAINQINT